MKIMEYFEQTDEMQQYLGEQIVQGEKEADSCKYDE